MEEILFACAECPYRCKKREIMCLFPFLYAACDCSGNMALTDKLAGDYRSQRRYSADKKRYPSGLVSDKTPTPFYGSGGKQFLRCRGLRRWVQKNNSLVAL